MPPPSPTPPDPDAAPRVAPPDDAAALLVVDGARGVLLQDRAGAWGVPDGWHRPGGLPRDAVCPRLLANPAPDAPSWTVRVADVVAPFEAEVGGTPSDGLAWVPIPAVAARPLEPRLRSGWSHLRPLLAVRPSVVVDGANVVGSVPDGWWKDRPAAALRLLRGVAAVSASGVPAATMGLPGARWFPRWTVVVEGRARATPDVAGVEVVRSPGDGDDAIAAAAERQLAAGFTVTVVTSDRSLARRVERAGATVRGARWIPALRAPR